MKYKFTTYLYITIIGVVSMVWISNKVSKSLHPLSSPKVHFFRYPHPPGIVEYVMDIDGKNQLRVFESDVKMIKKDSKIYSPDSSVFLSTIPTMNDTDLFLQDHVNSNIVNMTEGDGIEGDFQFSPDGSRLIYMSDREGIWNIYSLHLSSGTTTKLTNTGYGGKYPKYTPDGEKIVYVQDRRFPETSKYTPIDFKNLPPPSLGFSSDDLSDLTDGKPIQPDTLPDQQGIYIFTMNNDGTNHKNLTPDHSYSYNHIISPHGLNVLFLSNYNLWIVDIEGRTVKNLTSFDHTYPSPSSPSFSPDGNQVFYNRKVRKRGEYGLTHDLTKIFMVDVEGTRNVRISSEGSDYKPFFYGGESLIKDKYLPITEI